MLTLVFAGDLRFEVSSRYDEREFAVSSRLGTEAMTEYQIQPNTRRCAATGRELKPGDRFFTALLDEGHQWQRKDFSPEAWQGPPAGTFSFWTGHVPPVQEVVRPRFDDDVVEDCFHKLADQLEPSKVNFRYVVTLLLMRRKRFKLEATRREGDEERLVVRDVHNGAQYEVTNPRLDEEAMSQVQDEVFKVLGWA